MNENFDITYKALFRRYYPNLIFYATRLVGEEEAEDVVQDVFVELWKRKDTIEIGDQIQAFLYRAVYTRALNVLKHRNVEDGYCAAMEEINQRRAEFYQPDNNEVIRRIEDRELRKEIYDAYAVVWPVSLLLRPTFCITAFQHELSVVRRHIGRIYPNDKFLPCERVDGHFLPILSSKHLLR